MTDEQRHELEKRLEIHKKRLSMLERQAAIHGSLTPPHIQFELLEERGQITELEAQLGLPPSLSTSSATVQAVPHSGNTPPPNKWPSHLIFVAVGLIIGLIVIVGFVLSRQQPQPTSAQNGSLPSAPIIATDSVRTLPPKAAVPSEIEQPTAVIATAITQPTSAPTSVPTDAVNTIEINQELQIFPTEYHVTLKSIQIQPNGSMRWNFDFWNKARDAGHFGIAGNSYVVDNLGKRYGLLKPLDIVVQAGVQDTQSAEFEAPQPGANAFTLHIAGFAGVAVPNPIVTIQATLNTGSTSEPTATPVGAIGIGQELQIAPPEFHVTLTSIQILPDGSMRWNFDFWNKARDAGHFGIAGNSYVVDNLGKQYNLRKPLDLVVEAGVRTIESAEFDPPQPGANTFTLHIAGFAGVSVVNPIVPVQVVLTNGSATLPTPTPTGALVVNQELQIAPAEFHASITSIQILPDGSMRWNFDFWNKARDAGHFGIAGNSYVVDNLGKSYSLLKPLDIVVAAGVRATETAEFEAPQPGANVFTLHIAGFAGVGVLNPIIPIQVALNPGSAAQPTATPVGAIGISQELQIAPPEFHVTIASIQILPDGSMRWNFDFWNKARDAGHFGIAGDSYVVDNLGKRYNLVKPLDIVVQSGVRDIQSAEFEAPQAGINSFTLHIAGFAGVGVINHDIRVPFSTH